MSSPSSHSSRVGDAVEAGGEGAVRAAGVGLIRVGVAVVDFALRLLEDAVATTGQAAVVRAAVVVDVVPVVALFTRVDHEVAARRQHAARAARVRELGVVEAVVALLEVREVDADRDRVDERRVLACVDGSILEVLKADFVRTCVQRERRGRPRDLAALIEELRPVVADVEAVAAGPEPRGRRS